MHDENLDISGADGLELIFVAQISVVIIRQDLNSRVVNLLYSVVTLTSAFSSIRLWLLLRFCCETSRWKRAGGQVNFTADFKA